MKKPPILLLSAILLSQTLFAQWPWARISNIEYPIAEVFNQGNDLVAWSGSRILLSEDKCNYWKEIGNFGFPFIQGMGE